MKDPRLNLGAISFIMSLGCNLNCEYCWIADSKKNAEKANAMQKANIEALKDGTYLKNVLIALEKLHTDPTDIKMFSYWGQEPTLTLEYFTQNYADWIRAFPEVFRHEFSTNGMANADKIVEFVKTVDKYANRPTSVSIQFSYDGEYSTNNIRNANASIIKNNVLYVFDELSKINFQWVRVDFSIHAVLSMSMMYSLDTDDKLLAYYKEMDDYMWEIRSHIKSNQLYLGPQISLNLEAPYFAGRSDGEALTDFILRSRRLNYTNFHHPYSPAEDFLGVLAESTRWIRNDGFENQYEAIKELYITDKFQREPVAHLFCANNVEEIKIMYDGTLVNCQNYIFDKDLDNIPVDDSIMNGSKRSLVKHNYFMNAVTASQEELDKFIKFFLDLKFEGMSQMLSHTYNIMYVLALAGQIDKSYLTDQEKFLRHGYLISVSNNCAYNHLVETGTHYAKNCGYIRRYCNGVLDLVDKFVQEENSRGEKMPDQMGVLPWEREDLNL